MSDVTHTLISVGLLFGAYMIGYYRNRQMHYAQGMVDMIQSLIETGVIQVATAENVEPQDDPEDGD